MPTGIASYGTYLPHYRLNGDELARAHGSAASPARRVVASFDEDSTTMAVAACRATLTSSRSAPESVYLATTSPVYADKTNAAIVHSALGLGPEVFAADMAGSARGAIAAFKAAANSCGLAVLADVRTGRPASADEAYGGDGAAAFLLGSAGPDGDLIAELLAEASITTEVLDRWRAPGQAGGSQWEERFGLDQYLPLIHTAAKTAMGQAGLGQADHVVVVSPNSAVRKRAGKILSARLSAGGSPIGHAGAADLGLALAAVLDVAGAGETILALSAADGCDALVFRTTAMLPHRRQIVPVADQRAMGTDIAYPKYLGWRGVLAPEPPRRPDPERPAAPPAARALHWKYAFEGSQCRNCDFVHLPPARICKRCGALDQMDTTVLSAGHGTGTIATYTVDRLAYSPSPPMINAVVDFDGGGRYTMEVADADPSQLSVGTRVALTFRSLFVAGGVSNYFWKVQPLSDERVTADNPRHAYVGEPR